MKQQKKGEKCRKLRYTGCVTHSTILISENVDIKTVSARLGHAKTSTTLDIYTHAIKARDTVVADTLDNLFSKVQM